MLTVHRPGSFAARQAGCNCPQAINCWGGGEVGSTADCPTYTIGHHCPLHGERTGYVPQPLPLEPRTVRVPRPNPAPRPFGTSTRRPTDSVVGTCARCGKTDARLSRVHEGLCTESAGQKGCAGKYSVRDGVVVSRRKGPVPREAGAGATRVVTHG